MRIIEREEVRVFIDCFPLDLEELHIDFGDDDFEGCKAFVRFFRSLGLKVESDGFCVIVRKKE